IARFGPVSCSAFQAHTHAPRALRPPEREPYTQYQEYSGSTVYLISLSGAVRPPERASQNRLAGRLMTAQPIALPMLDARQRPLHDLRISVTDRCNFRCTYCMPKEIFGRDFQFLPSAQLLTFEEITRLARIFTGLGVEKIRLTGGEPLLRRDLERLVAM